MFQKMMDRIKHLMDKKKNQELKKSLNLYQHEKMKQ